MYSPDIRAACWFATTRPLLAAHVRELSVTAMRTKLLDNVLDFTKQLVNLYPNLKWLTVRQVLADKSPKAWGTKWPLDTLRAAKHILENSILNLCMDLGPDGDIRFHMLRFMACSNAAELASKKARFNTVDPEAELAKAAAKRPTKVKKSIRPRR